MRAARKVGEREQKAEKTKEKAKGRELDAGLPQAFGERRCAKGEDGEKQGTSRKLVQGKACPRGTRNEGVEEGESLAHVFKGKDQPADENCGEHDAVPQDARKRKATFERTLKDDEREPI